MTKMLQGWMVVPALGRRVPPAGPPRLLTRSASSPPRASRWSRSAPHGRLAVTLWPGSAPYIGGSTDGSVWDLILGYNGFGRLFGESGGGGGASFGGTAGLWRMFNEQVGGQVAWLLPLALISLVAGLWLTRRAPRTDRAPRRLACSSACGRSCTWPIFCGQEGIFHPYYVSALAPAVAALAGAGAVTLWRWAARSWAGLAVLDVAVRRHRRGSPSRCCTARRTSRRRCTRSIPVAAGGRRSSASRRAAPSRRRGARRARGRRRRAVLAVGSGPAAYSVATAGRALNGNNVIAGPAQRVVGRLGGGGMGRGQRRHCARSPTCGAPGLGEVPRRGDRLAVGGADHPRHRQAGRDDRRLQRQDPAPTVSQLAAMVAQAASCATC